MARLLLILLGCLVSFGALARCASFWNLEALGATQGDTVALYDRRGAPVLRVTTLKLRQLVSMKDRLASGAGLKAPLWLCDDHDPNAFAVARPPLVVVTLGLLNLVDWNADAMAGVMAHEVAHLSLGHSPAAEGKKALGMLEKLVGSSHAAVSGEGIGELQLSGDAVKDLYVLLYFKVKREDEQQADDAGIKLLTRVGINPQGALNAQLAFLKKFGDHAGGFLDSHPSMKARASQSRTFLATDASAKELVAEIRSEAERDALNTEAAERLIAANAWSKLGALTRTWVSKTARSAAAWYYSGLYRSRQSEFTAARRAFYHALEIEPAHAKARLELCVALHHEGRKLESVYCSQAMALADEAEEFKARTFGDRLWVGGNVEPVTAVLVLKDARGRKYLTNVAVAGRRPEFEKINYLGD